MYQKYLMFQMNLKYQLILMFPKNHLYHLYLKYLMCHLLQMYHLLLKFQMNHLFHLILKFRLFLHGADASDCSRQVLFDTAPSAEGGRPPEGSARAHTPTLACVLIAPAP